MVSNGKYFICDDGKISLATPTPTTSSRMNRCIQNSIFRYQATSKYHFCRPSVVSYNSSLIERLLLRWVLVTLSRSPPSPRPRRVESSPSTNSSGLSTFSASPPGIKLRLLLEKTSVSDLRPVNGDGLSESLLLPIFSCATCKRLSVKNIGTPIVNVPFQSIF